MSDHLARIELVEDIDAAMREGRGDD